MAIPHKIELPEGYTRELRQAVKKNKSGAWIYNLLNDIYKAGYTQAVKDYTKKINEEIDAIYQPDPSDTVDGEQLEPEGGEFGASERSGTTDADSGQGSAESESVADPEPGPI